jgi:hypothetical protein
MRNMSNSQELKEALRAVLVEKGDYATLASLIRDDEKREESSQLTQLIKPMSAVADILTENAKGAFMKDLEKRLDTEVEKATKDLQGDIKDAQDVLTKEIQSILTADRKELSAEVLTRIAEAQADLEKAQERYADALVEAKAEAMFSNLADLARLTEDEIADIIERSALSVESQIQGIIGDYIKETGISVSQITDFQAEVKKLIPTFDFSKIRISAAQVRGLPDYSGAASRAWVEKKIASIATGGNVTVANHGSVADTQRPNFDYVIWLGSVEPTNAIDNDIWYDTT